MAYPAKSPNLAHDIAMLGGLYRNLAWLGVKRLRHGSLWPWDARSQTEGPFVPLPLLDEESQEEREPLTLRR